MLETLNSHRGFTLIELMVVVSIMAILAALAAPSFRNFVAAQKVKTNAFNFYADLTLARSESIRRNAAVTVSGTSGSWNNGWTIAAGGETIKISDPLGTSVAIVGSATSVTFHPTGRLAAGSAVFTADISDSYNTLDTTKRCIRLDTSGLAKSMVGAC